MEKTAKIVKSTFVKEYANANGITYYHDIELDNMDCGSIGSRDKNPEWLGDGKELTYTIESGQYGNKIKRVSQGGNFGGVAYKKQGSESYEQKARTMALSYAKDLCIADSKTSLTDVITRAEQLYEWLIQIK